MRLGHVGLLFNKPPGRAEALFIKSSYYNTS